jgi:hypothetical protein
MRDLLPDHVRTRPVLGGNVRPPAESGQLPYFPRPTAASAPANEMQIPCKCNVDFWVAQRFQRCANGEERRFSAASDLRDESGLQPR